ncbi:hypothetical protein IWGMT90018_31410 [Mycobacterium kiyosense]|nr:hypothetical protein IWGMT90018_31410 [Mycobacterium kiyosense]
MSAIPRFVSVSLAAAAAVGLILPIGLAPAANALPCSAPEANVPPPANAVVTNPGGKVLGPLNKRPRGANDRAPLPRVGPLQRMLQPGQRYSAPIQQQARVPGANPGPPAPTPPAAGQQPQAAQMAPEAAVPRRTRPRNRPPPHRGRRMRWGRSAVPTPRWSNG